MRDKTPRGYRGEEAVCRAWRVALPTIAAWAVRTDMGQSIEVAVPPWYVFLSSSGAEFRRDGRSEPRKSPLQGNLDRAWNHYTFPGVLALAASGVPWVNSVLHGTRHNRCTEAINLQQNGAYPKIGFLFEENISRGRNDHDLTVTYLQIIGNGKIAYRWMNYQYYYLLLLILLLIMQGWRWSIGGLNINYGEHKLMSVRLQDCGILWQQVDIKTQ